MLALHPSCPLVAFDLEAGPAPPEDAAFELLGRTSAAGIPTLVRVASAAAAQSWRELGAAWFAIEGGAGR